MRAKHTLSPEEAAKRIETLLRDAGEFTPEESAPEGMAARALARHKDRKRRTILWRTTFAATGLALSAACLLLFARWNPGHPSPSSTSEAIAKASPFLRGAKQTPHPQRSFAVIGAVPHTNRPAQIARTRLLSRKSGRVLTAFSARKTASRLPALWKVETVQTTRVSVLAPVWLAETDEAHTALALTPAVASIPLQDGDTIRVTCASAEDADHLKENYQ